MIAIKEVLEAATKDVMQASDFQEASAKISAQYDLVSNTLGSIINWIRQAQNSMMSLSSLYEWASLFSEEETEIDELRRRIRMVMLPQAESFLQTLASAERSRSVMQVIQKDFENVPILVDSASGKNKKFLEIFIWDPNLESSALSASLTALYEGDFDNFWEQLRKIQTSEDK